jgi:ribosomal protein S18 acetylase RimI-like enzyme
MNNTVIEVLNESDIEEYSKVGNEVMEEFNKEEIDGFQRWFLSIDGITSRRSWNDEYNEFRTLNFCAKCDDKIIGILEVENANHIQSFFVKKEFQNKGIGKSLIKFSLNFFKKRGLEILQYSVYSSDYAINIYKTFGFKGDGKRLYLRNMRKLKISVHERQY